MIEVDGSFEEGGGAIVRTALALSTVTRQSFAVNDIRKGRKIPGLKPQHLYCIKALEQLCNADVKGAEEGSLFLKYFPGKLISRDIEIDIGTAGSITLFLQAILLPSLFASRTMNIRITGGTDVKWSTPFDYMNNVFFPQILRFADVKARLLKRGYYPKGNGRIEIKITPRIKLNDFATFPEFRQILGQKVPKYNIIDQPHLIQIKGISHASLSLQKANVAERQAENANSILKKQFDVPIKIQPEYQDTLSTGSGITLWAIFSKNKDDVDENNPIRMGADALGEQGKKAELVGEEAVLSLINEIKSNAPVDSHLADQLLPFMALLKGSKIKTSRITNHSKSNVYAIEKFLDKTFDVDEANGVIESV